MKQKQFAKGVKLKYTGELFSFRADVDVEQMILDVKNRWVKTNLREFRLDSNYAKQCIIIN